MPAAPFVHVFMAVGWAKLDGAGSLNEGDAARLRDAGHRSLTAGAEGAGLLVWELQR